MRNKLVLWSTSSSEKSSSDGNFVDSCNDSLRIILLKESMKFPISALDVRLDSLYEGEIESVI